MSKEKGEEKEEWRRSACNGKHRLDSAVIAKQVAKQSRRRRDTFLQAYHCKFCGGWHVGNGKPRDTKAGKKLMRNFEGDEE